MTSKLSIPIWIPIIRINPVEFLFLIHTVTTTSIWISCDNALTGQGKPTTGWLTHHNKVMNVTCCWYSQTSPYLIWWKMPLPWQSKRTLQEAAPQKWVSYPEPMPTTSKLWIDWLPAGHCYEIHAYPCWDVIYRYLLDPDQMVVINSQKCPVLCMNFVSIPACGVIRRALVWLYLSSLCISKSRYLRKIFAIRKILLWRQLILIVYIYKVYLCQWLSNR